MRWRTLQGWARGVVGLAAMATSVLVAAQPAAQEANPAPAGTSEPARDALKEHYAAGRAAADSQDWPKAADEFSKAYALKPLAQLAGNLGEAELRLGRFRDAAEHISKFLREDIGATAEDRKAAEGWLSEAKKKIVTLKIEVEDPGVGVLIDDRIIGTTPLPPEVYVEPGPHTVVVRQGTARNEVMDVYYAGWTRVIRLKPKQVTVVPTATAATPPTVGGGDGLSQRKGLVIGGGVTAGAVIVAGVIFAGLSASQAGKADRKGGWDKCYGDTVRYDDCDELHRLRNDVAILAGLSTGMFAGGALIGSAVILYALGIIPPVGSSKKGAVSAMPVMAPFAGGLQFMGHF